MLIAWPCDIAFMTAAWSSAGLPPAWTSASAPSTSSRRPGTPRASITALPPNPAANAAPAGMPRGAADAALPVADADISSFFAWSISTRLVSLGSYLTQSLVTDLRHRPGTGGHRLLNLEWCSAPSGCTVRASFTRGLPLTMTPVPSIRFIVARADTPFIRTFFFLLPNTTGPFRVLNATVSHRTMSADGRTHSRRQRCQ